MAQILQLYALQDGERGMRTSFVALLALSLPAVALAEPYAVAKLAYASTDIPLGAPYNGVIDDNAPALGVDVGFGFSRKWALEIGAARYASLDGFGTPCVPDTACTLIVREIGGNDMTLYNVALVPRFTAGDTHVFARVGYYRANIDTNVDLPGAGDFHEDGLMLGVGARWYFSDPWSVSLEATRFDDNVRQISLGFGWGLRRGADRFDEEE
jgi:hypothetical protein